MRCLSSKSSLSLWFLRDPCQRYIVHPFHFSSRLASLTAIGLLRGNPGSSQLARFVDPPLSPFVWDWDTKKLTPCMFITITSEETANLIEYVIARGTGVGLGSLSGWSVGQSPDLLREDNKCWAAETTPVNPSVGAARPAALLSWNTADKQRGHKINNKTKSKAPLWVKHLPLGVNRLAMFDK